MYKTLIKDSSFDTWGKRFSQLLSQYFVRIFFNVLVFFFDVSNITCVQSGPYQNIKENWLANSL